MSKQTKASFLLELAAVLEKHNVDMDFSGTYAEGLCFELDCGGNWIALPAKELITPNDLKDYANRLTPQ